MRHGRHARVATIPRMPLAQGASFAGYTIVRLLGAGGMGEVYLAKHPRLPRLDAVKILPTNVSGDHDYRLRFAREADLAAKLWHPHIVGVHDRGEYDGQLWISMDYVEGTDAGQLLAQRYPAGMPVTEVAAVVTAIASALDYAHKQGLLHRDVKPANIMVTDGGQDVDRRVLLADFGIARTTDDVSGLTATNMTVGTVAYSAPEQLMGEDIDGRADQYALAATAYNLLTGEQLFPNSNPAVVISRHLNADPPKLADTRPDLAGLDPVLAAALAKNPADRFERCSDFARALAEQSGISSSLPAAPTTPRPAPSRTPVESAEQFHGPDDSAPAAENHRPRRRWATVAAAGVVVIVGALLVAVWQPWASDYHEPTRAPNTSPAGAAPPVTAVPPPPSGLFPASAIDTVLLTPTEINTLLGGASDPLIQVTKTTHGMLNNTNLVSPPGCVGVIFTAEHDVLASTGLTAMEDQALESPPSSLTTTMPLHIEQTAVVYPAPEQAQTVLITSQRQWEECARGRVSQGTRGQNGENGLTFTLGEVRLEENVLTVPMIANNHESGGSACQQAMAVRANVVVSARSCRYPEPPAGQLDADVSSVRPDAVPLANAMLDKVVAPPPSTASPTSSVPSVPPAPSSSSTRSLPAGGATGLPCNAGNAGKLGYDPTSGKEIACVNQALTDNSPPSWQWAQTPPMTTGLHDTGGSCDPHGSQIMSRSSDGYLIVCGADDRGDGTAGYWQHFLGPLE